ncbi:MAG: LpqN/LpqT family lipoprotein [Mycobacteriaceae bacterium]|nr:LpqN/LpqT family lipoprotein [Mycobacteriaceae bacterium]
MMQISRRWRVLAASLAIGAMGVVGFADATALADPAFPPLPIPAPSPAPAAVNPSSPAAVGNQALGAPATAPVPYPLVSPLPSAAPGPTTGAPVIVPASSGTLRDYLQAKGVKLTPQRVQDLTGLSVTLPMPARWTPVPDPNVPDAFAVIADRTGGSLYTSNAQVVVYKLTGSVDPREAITHGYIDSQQLPSWQTTNSSLADFGGFPSSIIEGTYSQDGMVLNTSRRHVIATSGSDKYLVSLAVTTALAQAVADGPATNAIVNGFRVTVPGVPAVPAAPAAPAVPGVPAVPAVPAAPAVPGVPAAPAVPGVPGTVPATTPGLVPPLTLTPAPAS